MGYVAVGEITDEKASKKAKLKLACLAHAMHYNFTAYSKIQEFNRIKALAKTYLKDVEASPFTQDGANALKAESSEAMLQAINEAETSIKSIEANVELNEQRQAYLLKAVTKDGYTEFMDRAFVVANPGRHPDFHKQDEENGGAWASDNRKLAELFIQDFKASLPTGTPAEAFSFKGIKATNRPYSKSDALIACFSHAFEQEARQALIKVTQLNLARIAQPDYPENLRTEVDPSLIHKLNYDDVKHVANNMPYIVDTTGSRHSAGELTMEILRSESPLVRLGEIPFQEQFPLIKIEHYATLDDNLRRFIDDAFGGPIGRSEDGYRKAMNICMGHYAEEMSKEFNLDRELSKIDDRIIGRDPHESHGPVL